MKQATFAILNAQPTPRERVLQLLRDTPPPMNYRWLLQLDDGLLSLRVQRREPWELTLGGRRLLHWSGAWQDQRELRAPTWEALHAQLDSWPEFLVYRVTSS